MPKIENARSPQETVQAGLRILTRIIAREVVKDRLGEVVQQILEEGEITEEGQQAVSAQANRLIRQAVELKDAVKVKRGHEAQWTKGSLV